MSNYNRNEDSRNKTLIIVEGDLEKNIILKILLPYVGEGFITFDNVQIYKSNIYNLYNDINEEYGEKWFEEKLPINLPFLISRRLNISPHLDERNYTNIILMFDYERHHSGFSDEKISKMQNHFKDMTGSGLLYINYPMIESLFHFDKIPGPEFQLKAVSVKCKPGAKYKNLVKQESKIKESLMLYDKMNKYLKKYISDDEQNIQLYVKTILSVTSVEDIGTVLKGILSKASLLKGDPHNLQCYLKAMMKQYSRTKDSIPYWDDLRNLILYIAKENIKKAYNIQKNNTLRNELTVKEQNELTVKEQNELTVKEQYNLLDWNLILEQQNKFSADSEKGFIYVLCTCITFLGEYKFFWN